MKRYGQACSIARTLDVVGERWNLLLVRELLLGPRRHRDLASGLPGIPSSVLAARLKDLQACGVVLKRTLPAPADVPVYELTDAGYELLPALQALMAWGDRYAPGREADDAVRPSWAMLSAIGRPTTLPDGLTCELRLEDEVFYLGADDGTLTVRRGPALDGDVVVTMSADTLYHLIIGQATATEALENSTTDGDITLAHHALEPFAGTGTPRPATTG